MLKSPLWNERMTIKYTEVVNTTFVVKVKPTDKSGDLDDSVEIFQLFHWLLQNVSMLMEARPVPTTQGIEVKV